MIESHRFEVKKTAHYYSLGTPSASTKYFWIVCHGYGHLASDFIKNFSSLNSDEHFIIAPEGLSRFYWKGFSGRIAATWMTSKDRLVEIEDYSNYIHNLYHHYLPKLSPDVEIVLLGFSQGCATQVRWILNKLPKFDHLVLWAGLFPEDINYAPHHEYLKQKQLTFLYGDEDQFLNEAYVIAQKEFIKSSGLEVDYIPFAGKHEVLEAPLLELVGKF